MRDGHWWYKYLDREKRRTDDNVCECGKDSKKVGERKKRLRACWIGGWVVMYPCSLYK